MTDEWHIKIQYSSGEAKQYTKQTTLSEILKDATSYLLKLREDGRN